MDYIHQRELFLTDISFYFSFFKRSVFNLVSLLLSTCFSYDSSALEARNDIVYIHQRAFITKLQFATITAY